MSREKILDALKSGALSEIEALRQLRALNRQPKKGLLSEGQKGLWVLQKMAPDMHAYNLPVCIRIRGNFNRSSFQAAYHFVLEQNPVLSCPILEEDGIPYRASSGCCDAVEYSDISGLSENQVPDHLREKMQKPFALHSEPPMRAHVLARSADEAIVLFVVHHIAFDAASVYPFLAQLFAAYHDAEQGKAPASRHVSGSYDDFVAWEQDMLKSAAAGKHLAYWREHLSNAPLALEMPTDRPLGEAATGACHMFRRRITGGLKEKLAAFRSSQNLTNAVILLGVYKLLLGRRSGQNDLVVGMSTAIRPKKEFTSLVGYSVGMVPIRTQMKPSATATEFMQDLKRHVAAGLDHSAYPFSNLVRDMKIPRSLARSPIFQVVFTYQNAFNGSGLQTLLNQYAPILSVEFVPGLFQKSEYELAMEIYESEEALDINLKYRADLFDRATIEELMRQYETLLENIIDRPQMPLSEQSLLRPPRQTSQASDQTMLDIGILPAAERHRMLVEWNVAQAYPQDQCIHQLFEGQVEKTPDAVALTLEGRHISYGELNVKANRLAHYLREIGVRPDAKVAICVERSFEMVIALLATLKAGGAYVPLDPAYPAERLAHMLSDSDPVVVLAHGATKSLLEELGGAPAVVDLDADHARWDSQSADNPSPEAVQLRSSHLAYIIYTSGSTGKPKGVMIEHRNVVRLMHATDAWFHFGPQDVWSLFHSFAFDFSVWEIWGALAYGGRLVVIPLSVARSPDEFYRTLCDTGVTILNQTPSAFKQLITAQVGSGQEHSLRHVIFGGEALEPRTLTPWYERNGETKTRLINMYGITETTVHVTYRPISAADTRNPGASPIGGRIPDLRIYILDQQRQPAPIGTVGELYVGGAGVARGYLNRPELTAERFLADPFAGDTDARMYKTGDLGKYLPDGSIEYLGRNDSQVKIRGFRIELGEIEAQLSRHAGIRDCVVVVKVNEQEEHKQLAAYYVAKAGIRQPLDERELREFLKSHLPHYMIPAQFTLIEQIPLTPNGKADKKRLAQMEANRPSPASKVMPATEIEAIVAAIWKKALNRDEIDVNDGFFEIGGDSILAVKVAERMRQHLQCEVSVTKLFQHSSIKAISQHIAQAIATDADRLPIPATDPSVAQEAAVQTMDQSGIRHPDYYESAVAVIGISCQFPGAEDHAAFWDNLSKGKEGIETIPVETLRELGVPERILKDPRFIPVRSTIKGKDSFDPAFFKISMKDAELMDPQLRLLLQHSWKAIEDAGYLAREIPETSVLISSSNNFYGVFGFSEDSSNTQENFGNYQSFVLSQSGTIPTIISFKLGLKGPSYTVHSNCSSSLVGLYQGYQSLIRNEVRQALVGAATLHVKDSAGYFFQEGMNFSSDGHVKTFDAQADGMVGGEGVAVILLKRAVDAIADGDHIYGLIRGVAVNNDGVDKAGFYAPSVQGQADVICKALDTAGVHPETISYIEAHGTGTLLGDPIEFSGLQEAFGRYTGKRQFCGLGSVKSNIGHMDTAAGLAGVIKVALAMENREMPPTINFTTVNERLDLANSPFYIAHQGRKLDDEQRPCRAGVSAFGLGGTNAHAILEQAPARPANSVQILGCAPGSMRYLVPLSARNGERLREYASLLLQFVRIAKQANNGDMADLAYTLQVGREAMEERLAFVAGSLEELEGGLQDYLAGSAGKGNVYRGQIKRGQDALTAFDADEDMVQAIDSWIAKGKHGKLLDLWVKGYALDWNKLYGAQKPRRISLPTYPFARERYWKVPASRPHPAIQATAGAAMLHPLLHRNTSDLSEQRFSSVFTGSESFLRGHVVEDKRALSATACLEMARAAVEQAAGIGSAEAVRLRNIEWAQPIAVQDAGTEVHIGLHLEDDGGVAFEIYTRTQGGNDDLVIHCQGVAEIGGKQTAGRIDLQTLQMESGQDRGPVLLDLPALAAGDGRFVLHPDVMDHAITAVLGGKPPAPFALDELEVFAACTNGMWAVARTVSDVHETGSANTRALDIDLCDGQGNVCVALRGLWVQEATLAGDSMPSALTAQAPGAHTGNSPEREVCNLMTFEERWEEQAIAAADQRSPGTLVLLLSNPENREAAVQAFRSYAPDTQLIFLVRGDRYLKRDERLYSIPHDDRAAYVEALRNIREEAGGIGGILNLWPLEDRACIQDPSSMIYLLQAIAETKIACPRLLLAAQAENALESCYIDALIGFERSLGLVLPQTKVAVVYQNEKQASGGAGSSGQDWMRQWSQRLWQELQADKVQSVRYEAGSRQVCRTVPTSLEPNLGVLRSGATYLITGGASGLGLLFATYLARTYSPKLILTGRAVLDEKRRQGLKALESLGSEVIYLQADVSDESAMQAGLQAAKAHFGDIHGLFHVAGLNAVSSVLNKKIEHYHQVLAPKVQGTLVLDRLLRNEPLEFICYFSSASAIVGDFGSCDYAVANRFLMAYAHYRNELALSDARVAHTCVINWGPWKEGGMGAGEEWESTHTYLKFSGQRVLEEADGTSILESLLSQTAIQHLVLAGQPQRLLRFLGIQTAQEAAATMQSAATAVRAVSMVETHTPSAPIREQTASAGAGLPDCIERDLKKHVSELLNMPRERIDMESNLADFGFDSISLTDLARRLSTHYGLEITPALFFGHPTLGRVVAYFMESEASAMQAFYRAALTPAASAEPKPAGAQPGGVVRQAAISRPKRTRSVAPARDSLTLEPIAIVGMSGKFPGAEDIDGLWKNLLHGNNCITEIPASRWNWREQEASQDANDGIIKWGGFIDGIDEFDSLFFGIAPSEAAWIDPQQRLLMTYVWKAIEDAGILPSSLSQSPTGVFAAVGACQYMNGEAYRYLTPNRISYALNLQGPSEFFDTGCSATLVALHRAIQSIRQGECRQAIVGAVNLFLSPDGFKRSGPLSIVSADGQSKPFQQDANGYVRSEGVGALIVKPLSQAIADRNEIYAVIRGTGVAHGGKGVSLISPNADGMRLAMKQAFRNTGVDPRTVTYIEPHGVSSPLADAIEINALASGYRELVAEQPPAGLPEMPCHVGNSKPCIGHSEIASGLASMIKVVMAMRNRIVPGIARFTKPSEHISLEKTPFRMGEQNHAWERTVDAQGQPVPYRAGINSYGLGGVNAYALLEEYQPSEALRTTPAVQQFPQLMVMSARTQERLCAKARQMLIFLEVNKDVSVSNLAYTLHTGREAMEARLAWIVNDRSEIADGLVAYLRSVEKNASPDSHIPIFAGDIKGGLPSLMKLFSGKEGESLLQAFAAERNLEKLALYWTSGGAVSWEMLYAGQDVRRIALPTYPFEKRRCWIDARPKLRLVAESPVLSVVDESLEDVGLADRVIGVFANAVGVEVSELKQDEPLSNYGFDSVLFLGFFRRLQLQVDSSITVDTINRCKTLQEIIDVMTRRGVVEPVATALMAAPNVTRCSAEYPELVHLNASNEGRPVFWIHPAEGDVAPYYPIAQKCERPFYGVEMRGWVNDLEPIYGGIPAQAKFYVQVIQSLQPEGPYDLGGYSVGGSLAYEVARLLQEKGQKVETLVLLDAFDSTTNEETTAAIKANNFGMKGVFFSVINWGLFGSAVMDGEDYLSRMIHRDEVDVTLDDKTFFDRMYEMAKERGLKRSKRQMRDVFAKRFKALDRIIRQWKESGITAEPFSVLPLPDPEGITCYFFHNGSGMWLGKMEPYLGISHGDVELDHINYWQEFVDNMPNFHFMKVESLCHPTLLADPKSRGVIETFCEKLYSHKTNPQCLPSFDDAEIVNL